MHSTPSQNMDMQMVHRLATVPPIINNQTITVGQLFLCKRFRSEQQLTKNLKSLQYVRKVS